jgi:hypothetical protein
MNMKVLNKTTVCILFMLLVLLVMTACNGNKTTETGGGETVVTLPVTEIETQEPVQKVAVTLNVRDQEENPISNTVITIVPVQDTVESATLTADSEGSVNVELPVGEYTVRFDVLPEYVLGIETSLTVVPDMEPVTLYVTDNTPNGSEERPFFIMSDTEIVTIPAGTTYHFTLFGGNDRTLIIENSDAVITYKETEYKPDESGRIEIRMSTENPRDPSFFALTNSGKEAVEMTVILLSDPGSMSNPIPVEVLGEVITAKVPQENMVYYKWVATASGTLTVRSTDTINNISLNNLTTSQVSSFTEGKESETLAVSEGDEITIVVSVLGGDKNAEYNPVSFSLTLAE